MQLPSRAGQQANLGAGFDRDSIRHRRRLRRFPGPAAPTRLACSSNGAVLKSLPAEPPRGPFDSSSETRAASPNALTEPRASASEPGSRSDGDSIRDRRRLRRCPGPAAPTRVSPRRAAVRFSSETRAASPKHLPSRARQQANVGPGVTVTQSGIAGDCADFPVPLPPHGSPVGVTVPYSKGYRPSPRRAAVRFQFGNTGGESECTYRAARVSKRTSVPESQ